MTLVVSATVRIIETDAYFIQWLFKFTPLACSMIMAITTLGGAQRLKMCFCAPHQAPHLGHCREQCTEHQLSTALGRAQGRGLCPAQAAFGQEGLSHGKTSKCFHLSFIFT